MGSLSVNSNYKCVNDSLNYPNKRVLETKFPNMPLKSNADKINFDTFNRSNFDSATETKEEKSKLSKNTWIKIGITAAAIVGGAIILKKTGAFDKIKDFINGEKLVDADNELFSFAKKHPLKAPGGIYSEDGLVITHITDYLPRDGYIDTARSAVRGARNSVHFAVNHGVTGHILGEWSGKHYAVIMPMEGALNTAGNKFVGGVAGDFYSFGRVKIPKGSVLVRYNESIPAGKYRISDISKIKELRGLKGVKLIETSAEDMKKTVDNVIQKMGYELRDTTEAFYWGNIASKTRFREFNRFNKFLKAHGMIPMIHSHTPNGKIEILISNIMMRALTGKNWTFVNEGAVFDAKEDALSIIKYIEKYAKKTKYPLDFDLSTLRDIVSKSETPNDAMQKIKEIMGISTSMLEQTKINAIRAMDPVMQDVSLIMANKMTISGHGVAVGDEIILRHLSKSSQKTQTQIIDGSFSLMEEIDNFIKRFKVEDVIKRIVEQAA